MMQIKKSILGTCRIKGCPDKVYMGKLCKIHFDEGIKTCTFGRRGYTLEVFV